MKKTRISVLIIALAVFVLFILPHLSNVVVWIKPTKHTYKWIGKNYVRDDDVVVGETIGTSAWTNCCMISPCKLGTFGTVETARQKIEDACR